MKCTILSSVPGKAAIVKNKAPAITPFPASLPTRFEIT